MAESKIELIDFFAPWCGPCKGMESIFEDIEKDYGDKITITKYNVDEHQEKAASYNVLSIPTYLIVKDGKVINQLTGAQPKAALEKIINDVLEK